jgi:hypothetical protein
MRLKTLALAAVIAAVLVIGPASAAFADRPA